VEDGYLLGGDDYRNDLITVQPAGIKRYITQNQEENGQGAT